MSLQIPSAFLSAISVHKQFLIVAFVARAAWKMSAGSCSRTEFMRINKPQSVGVALDTGLGSDRVTGNVTS